MRKDGEEVPCLSPEMDVILWSIGVRKNREAAIGKILKKNINWMKVKKNALSHNVLPLLYGTLKNLGEPLVPQGEMNQIKSLYRNISLKNLRQAQKLHRVIELLSANGIAVIAFKGLALSIQAYGDLSPRNFCDLDLLIQTKDFNKIYDVLTAAGFHSNFPLTNRMKRYWMVFRRDFEFSDGTNILDFHHQITQGPRRISLKEKIWENQCTEDLLSREIPVLSPEHSLLTLCIHGTKNQWRTLSVTADIAHLISRHPGLNWKTLVSDAKEIGCFRMLCIGLLLSRQICGLELPDGILELGRKNRKARKFASKYLHQLLIIERTGKTGKLYETLALIKSLDSFGPRIKYLGHFAFTPTPMDWKFIKLPGFLYPLYYVIRPFRLLVKLISRSFSSLFLSSEQKQTRNNQEKMNDEH
jgi:hypothetical protein